MEAIKLGMLAKSCLCPGLLTVVQNIIATCSNDEDNNIVESLSEYKASRGYEVYCITTPNKFIGRKF